VRWPRTRKWKCTWVYCLQFRIITWRRESWLPAFVPISVLITKSVFQTCGEYLEGRDRKWKTQMRKIYCFHLWWWKRASWLAMGKYRGYGVHLWEVSFLEEEGTLVSVTFWWVLSLCTGWSGICLKSVSEKFPMPGCCLARFAAFCSHAAGE